jgi:hypothetical protein
LLDRPLRAAVTDWLLVRTRYVRRCGFRKSVGARPSNG